MLPYSLARPVETVAADYGHCEEVVGWAEAPRGKIALFGLIGVSLFGVVMCVCGGSGWLVGRGEGADLILYGLVAAGWGEILGHFL